MLFLLVLPVAAFGCSYYSYPDPPTEYIVSRTKTIFLGTLLQKVFREAKIEGDRYKIHMLTFRIDKALKGGQSQIYRIEYAEKVSRRSSCDEDPPDQKVGEQWVVFDGYDEGEGVWNVRNPAFLSWRYSIDHSGRLKKIRDAVEHPSSTFFGEVEMAMFDSPPNHKIQAELLDPDKNSVIQTVDVQDGRFDFPDLKPGIYFVRLRSSKLEKLLAPEPVEMVKDATGHSFYVDFRIRILPGRPEFETFALSAF
jgi:hypothetical protein